MMQKELAVTLASELQDCGHDVAWLDILDALASTNLVLAPALHGNGPAEEYIKAVRGDEE